MDKRQPIKKLFPQNRNIDIFDKSVFPKGIISDRGTTSATFKKFIYSVDGKYAINAEITSSTNGQIERYNCTLTESHLG